MTHHTEKRTIEAKQTEAQRLADELDKHREWLYLKQMHSQSMAEAATLLRRQDELLEQALDLIECQRAWIAAVPHELPLPAMPGFDGVWGEQVEAAIRAHLEAK